MPPAPEIPGDPITFSLANRTCRLRLPENEVGLISGDGILDLPTDPVPAPAP